MEIKRQFQLTIGDPSDDTSETVEVAILRHRNMTMAVILPTGDVTRYNWQQISSVVFRHPKDQDDDAVAEKYAMLRACGVGLDPWERSYSKAEAARRRHIYHAYRKAEADRLRHIYHAWWRIQNRAKPGDPQ